MLMRVWDWVVRWVLSGLHCTDEGQQPETSTWMSAVCLDRKGKGENDTSMLKILYNKLWICNTSIDARLWQASLLWCIFDGASAKALQVCARFSVGGVSNRKLFLFSWAFGDQGRDWNALTCHFTSEINISEHASSASLVANTAGNLLACFQVLEQHCKSSKLSNRCAYVAREPATGSDN